VALPGIERVSLDGHGLVPCPPRFARSPSGAPAASSDAASGVLVAGDMLSDVLIPILDDYLLPTPSLWS
jgi:hypothetical protein